MKNAKIFLLYQNYPYLCPRLKAKIQRESKGSVGEWLKPTVC